MQEFNDKNNKALSLLKKFKNELVEFITEATGEWLQSLLNQPTKPPFAFNADFESELARTVRLVVAVLCISGILVGTLDFFKGQIDASKTVAEILIVFIVAIFIALIYKPFFFLAWVRIRPKRNPEVHEGDPGKPANKPLNMSQVFYSVLYTFVPWIPILIFVRRWLVSQERGILRDFLFWLALPICTVYILVNLAKAIRVITNAPWYRIWIGILIPVVFLFAYFIWVFLD